MMRDRNGLLFLLDFGAVKQETVGSTPSGRSTGIYSMGFAPPEQMAGSQVYPSTDLYALAATCINLLTGKRPEELYDSYHNQWNWKAFAPTLSDRLAAIFDCLLQPAPKDRFQSAQEVLNALVAQPSTPPPPPPQSGASTHLQPSPTPSGKSKKQPVPVAPSPAPLAQRQPFALLEVLSSAAFTGFEGSLLYIAFASLLPSPSFSIGLLGMCLGGLIYAQYRRILEGKDFPILAVLTFALLLIPALRGNLAIPAVAIIAVLGGAAAVAITAIFRLIYQILARFL
jgi:serine/threonine-protein kinase